MKSFKIEVIADNADNSGKWAGNGIRLATFIEAENYASDLADRWTLVRETRVVESEDDVNYSFIDWTLKNVERVESQPA